MAKWQIMSKTSSIRSLSKVALAGTALLLCSGCSMTAGSDLKSLYTFVKQSLHNDSSVTYEEAAASPYASIGVRLDGGPQAMLILATDSGYEQLWTSAERIVIVTHSGLVIRTVGIGHDLGSTRLASTGPQYPQTASRWADFPDLGLYGVALTCEKKIAGTEAITILGNTRNALRTDEHCKTVGSAIAWSFTNTYWTDPASGQMQRSFQYFHPRLGPLDIEVFRQPIPKSPP
jgi:Protein of unknown function (DUF2886).